MRRAVLSSLAVSLCVIAGGCGSSGSKASNQFATELSYFPTGTPFVAAVATDPNGAAVQSAKGLLGAFPLANLGISALESQLETLGINYQTDIEPLYQNPVVLGVLQVPGSASLSGTDFLAVWIVKDASKLDALVKKDGMQASGHHDGATLYRSGGATLAVDGATAVFGSAMGAVDTALDDHAHRSGISAADYSRAMGNLPRNTLVQAFGSLTSALSGAKTTTARRIPWVASIRSYAASVSAGSTGLTVRFRIDTSGGSLTSAELPIASGATAPQIVDDTIPIAAGVRDPAQAISFLEAVDQAVAPASYARFQRRENAAKSKSGYDLNTFVGLLTGDLIIQSDTRTTMGRVGVRDPASAARQLAKLPQVARDIFHTAKGVSRRQGGFYAIREAGGKSLTLGLVGSEFVAGLATPAQLRAFAAVPTAAVAGANGSVAFRVTLVDLLRIVLKSPPSGIVQSVLSSLGNVTGSVSATTSALTGSLSLAVK